MQHHQSVVRLVTIHEGRSPGLVFYQPTAWQIYFRQRLGRTRVKDTELCRRVPPPHACMHRASAASAPQLQLEKGSPVGRRALGRVANACTLTVPCTHHMHTSAMAVCCKCTRTGSAQCRRNNSLATIVAVTFYIMTMCRLKVSPSVSMIAVDEEWQRTHDQVPHSSTTTSLHCYA